MRSEGWGRACAGSEGREEERVHGAGGEGRGERRACARLAAAARGMRRGGVRVADSERSGARAERVHVPGSSGERRGACGRLAVRRRACAWPSHGLLARLGGAGGSPRPRPGRDGCGAGLTCLSLKM